MKTKFDFPLFLTRSAVVLVVVATASSFIKPVQNTVANQRARDSVTHPKSISDRFSQGKKALFSDEVGRLPESICPPNNHDKFDAFKESGLRNVKAGNYAEAVNDFETAFTICPGPETLIYLNNAKAEGKDPYTVAVSVPISGANPSNALEMLRGFAQAQLEVNSQAESSNSRPLKLMVIDDGDDPESARQIAAALTDGAKYADVLAIAGHWTSDVSLAAASVYHNRKSLAFITPVSTTNEISGFSPWVFRSTINNLSGSRAMANYMLETWGKKKAAIFCVEGVTYSQEICTGFQRSLTAVEGEVVAEFNLGASDFDAQRSVDAAIAQGAETILLATNNDSVDRAIDVIAANSGRLKLLGDLANLYTLKTLQEGGDDARDMVMAIAWHPDSDANPAFVEASTRLWRGQVNYVTAMSYGSLQALIEAAQIEPSRAGIRDALSAPDFAAPSADQVPLSFDTMGDRPTAVQLVKVLRKTSDSSSGSGFDFVPVYSSRDES